MEGSVRKVSMSELLSEFDVEMQPASATQLVVARSAEEQATVPELEFAPMQRAFSQI